MTNIYSKFEIQNSTKNLSLDTKASRYTDDYLFDLSLLSPFTATMETANFK